MKTSALFMIASAVAVMAAGEDEAKKMCKKEGEAYCLGGSIILRCEGEGKGYAGQCNANLSGYPPAGGIASCYEETKGSGKGACEKNCIVHAEPSFTLPADKCTPSATDGGVTPTPEPTHSNNGTEPTQPPITAGANKNAIGGMAAAGLFAAYIM